MRARILALAIALMLALAPGVASAQMALIAPAPPQVQAWSPSHGRSGWASQTQPLSSQSEHFME